MAWLVLALLMGMGVSAYLLWVICSLGISPGFHPPVDPVSIPEPGTSVLIIVGLLLVGIFKIMTDRDA